MGEMTTAELLRLKALLEKLQEQKGWLLNAEAKAVREVIATCDSLSHYPTR